MGFIFVLLLLLPRAGGAAAGAPGDPNKQILAALTSGDAKALSAYLNDRVDLGVGGTEGTYSRVQATRILEEFFSKNPVKSVKINRQGTSSGGSYFSLGEMQAGSKTYRLYYLMKQVNGAELIHLLQIQDTK